MKTIEKINGGISKVLSFIMIVFFIAMTLIYAMQVFARYVLNKGFTWTEELTRYGMIWLVFMGTAWIVFNSEHVKVTIIEDLLKKAPKRIVNICQDIVSLIFVGAIFYFSFSQLKLAHMSVSANTGINNMVPYLIFPISMLLCAWGYICRLVKWFKKPEKVEDEKEGGNEQ